MYRILSALLFCVFSLTGTTASAFAALEDSVNILPDVDSILVCEGTSITLSATAADSYSWTPPGDFDDPTAQTVSLTPSQSQWYVVTAQVDSIECIDSIYVTIVDPTFEVSGVPTDTLCPETPVDIAFSSNVPITGVTWMPLDGIEDPDSTGGTRIRPLETTEYIVTVDVANCTRSDTFTINVIPFRLDLITEDTVFLCKPDSSTIRLNIEPDTLTLVWSPLDTTIEVQGPRALVYPEVSTNYNVTSMFMGCTLSRDIFVRVDSLPPLDLSVIPDKDPYCEGEMIFIIGVNVDTSLYPDIEFQWTPEGQIQDSSNTANVLISLQDTTEFVRMVTNNACVDSSSVLVNVIPLQTPLSVMDTLLCPGDMFVVEVLDPDVTEIMWEPTDGLSCSDCPNPTVTVPEGGASYTMMGEKEGCPVQGNLNVGIKPDYLIPVSDDSIASCEGAEIQFTIDDTIGIENLNISISDGAGSLSCTDCTNPTVTIEGNGTITITADLPADDTLFCRAFREIPVQIAGPETNTATRVICPGEETVIDLSDQNFMNPMIVSITGGSASCNDANCDLVSVVIPPESSGETLIIEDETNNPDFCGRTTSVSLVTPAADPFEWQLDTSGVIGVGEIVNVTIIPMPSPPAGTSYSWSVNGNVLPDMGPTAMVPLNETMNVVSVSWINSAGCEQTATITIEAQEPTINIPNAFTPNGDDANERFGIEIIGNIQLTEFLIFNRWGQVVYDEVDPQGWDGTFNGEPAPPEVYVYLARFRYPNGNTETRKGDLTLIR